MWIWYSHTNITGKTANTLHFVVYSCSDSFRYSRSDEIIAYYYFFMSTQRHNLKAVKLVISWRQLFMYSLYWHIPIASTWSNPSDYSQRTKKLFQQFSNDVYETVPRHKKWGWWKIAALYGIHGVCIPHWDVPLYFAIPIFYLCYTCSAQIHRANRTCWLIWNRLNSTPTSWKSAVKLKLRSKTWGASSSCQPWVLCLSLAPLHTEDATTISQMNLA